MPSRPATTVRTGMIAGLLFLGALATRADDAPQYERQIAPLLKRHCVKCHGPTRHEGNLNLAGTAHPQGKSGAAVVPHDLNGSLLWHRVSSDEMPPDNPLSADEKQLLRAWIVAGAPGGRQTAANPADHWAFRVLPSLETRPSRQTVSLDEVTPIDSFIAQDLDRDGIGLSPCAPRSSQIRRLAFDLTGLPPDPRDIVAFEHDTRPDAYERLMDRYLASPHFGERFGKLWLDAAGYADSNGYFGADTDRPLAYRYRDYVIRAINADRSLDRFIREQIAGDELVGVTAANGGSLELPAEQIELLEATHYLRCGQDGTGESDGNPDELRVDRYTVLETAMQNLSTGLLGLTIQCAKCHDHKFEPLTQRDYYQFQAVLLPAFPPEQWVKPNDRFLYATQPGEHERWQAEVARADADVSRLSDVIAAWAREHRPRGNIVLTDAFETTEEGLVLWSNTAPGDDIPGGTGAVNVNSREAPGALILNGRLHLFEGGPGGDKWLSTRAAIDWTPDPVGAAIQVTFDLVDHQIDGSATAERFGYFLALHDFNDNSDVAGGNILIDGHPSGSTAVFVDYPGSDTKQVGSIGKTGYKAGRNYGVRITNQGQGKFLLEHLVDWQTEPMTLTLSASDLPDGGFGFEFCCGRSFVVDNVVIESFSPATPGNPLAEFSKALEEHRQPLEAALQRRAALGTARPGRIAWTTDVVEPPPAVHVLQRGNYKSPGEPVGPGGFAVLNRHTETSARTVPSRPPLPRGSGRRRDFAEWLTAPQTPQSSLVARVHANRLWQHHFGTGIVATADNLGLSGAPPSHPELLDWLAARLIRSDWSSRSIVRQIVQSTTYRQSSDADTVRSRADPDATRGSRFPVRRLDAEAIRDMLLAASGDFDDRMGGPFVATARQGSGEIVVPENASGAYRRSIYLQQKRTQIHTLLQVFDAPSIVFNSTRRARSTMPLQSLSLMNSDFVNARAQSLAARLFRDCHDDAERLDFLFRLTTGNVPTENDVTAAHEFLIRQTQEFREVPHADRRAWADLCQILMIGNSALYLD